MQIISTAEPFFLPGGPIGCVLVHGFTGSPKEMRMLGDHLHQHGYSVLGVRLAGHATNMEDMIRSRYCDWLASVEDGYHLLRPHCQQIFLMGLSMGGVISLVQASRLPVDGVVAMSAPYYFPVTWARRFPWLIRLISPFMRTRKKGEGIWFLPELEASHVHYPRDPVRSGFELFLLLEEMKTALPKITVPSLVIHSRDDQSISIENAEQIYQRLGSRQKDLVLVDQANHVITRDGDTSRVYNPITRFIENSLKTD